MQVSFYDIHAVACYVTDHCFPILPTCEPCEFPCEISHDILMYVESRQKNQFRSDSYVISNFLGTVTLLLTFN